MICYDSSIVAITDFVFVLMVGNHFRGIIFVFHCANLQLKSEFHLKILCKKTGISLKFLIR